MPNIPTWIVQLFVNGPIAVDEPVRFQHPKGFNRRRKFYSDIKINTTSSGLRMSVTAYAGESDLARKAALVFVGAMLDVMAADLKLPLRLSLYDAKLVDRAEFSVKRVVNEMNFKRAFQQARKLSDNETTFLRALSWYRKGLITEDPFDRFLAFWISIEIVAGKYHPNVPEAKKGSKSQIWECFKNLWGDCSNWPLIAGQDKWIDEIYELRQNIAHGTAPVDVDEVERVLMKTDTILNIAHLFLNNFKNKLLNQLDPRIAI